MDLILLEIGDNSFFGGTQQGSGGTSIESAWKGAWPATINAAQCIELVSLDQSLKQTVTTDVSNSARTSGRPIVSEITCVKYLDRASVRMNDCCLRAVALGRGKDQPARIHMARNDGDSTFLVMTIALRDALVSSISLQTHPDDMPTEQFTLNFTEIIWTYMRRTSDGKPAGIMTSGWSLARNRPIAQFSDD
jgi:type VI secretion system secreted protein Hcp